MALVAPGRKLILGVQSDSGARLPQISIPRWSRTAAEVHSLIRNKWGLAAFALHVPKDNHLTSEDLIVAELLEETQQTPELHHWISTSELGDDLTAMECSLIEALFRESAEQSSAFSRLGWVRETLDWVGLTIGNQYDRSSIRQYNSQSDTALLQIAADIPPPLWLKAVANENSREYRVTVLLSRLFPRYLPKLIAARDDWHAWLTEHAGRPLSSFKNPSTAQIEAVAVSLAELQMESTEHIAELVEAGCLDQRLVQLPRDIYSLIPYLEAAMARSVRRDQRQISPLRLREIGGLVESACQKLEAIGIPDSIIHNDINLDNLLLGSGGCVILDWANAGVGNPFTTAEILRVQLAQAFHDGVGLKQFLDSYRRHWRTLIPDAAISEALTFCPLVAAASHLCSSRSLLLSEQSPDLERDRFARALARQLDRAARISEPEGNERIAPSRQESSRDPPVCSSEVRARPIHLHA